MSHYRDTLHKIMACFLATLVLAMTTPPVFAAEQANQAKLALPKVSGRPIPPAPQPKGGVKHGPRVHTVTQPVFKLSDNPTDLDLSTCVAFQEPLFPLTGTPVSGENAALAKAIKAFRAKQNLDDLSALTGFIKSNPKSRWTPSLEATVGNLKFTTGYLSDAIELWSAAWEAANGERGRDQTSVANGAFANLVILEARLGRRDELRKYFAQINKRPFFGTDEAKVKAAEDGLGFMNRCPQRAFKCGPFAIDTILHLSTKGRGRNPILKEAESTVDGTTLAQVKGWADQVGLKYQIAKRSPGTPFVTPAVAHWKLDHFCAVVGQDNGRYLLQDPTFDNDSQISVSAAALRGRDRWVLSHS